MNDKFMEYIQTEKILQNLCIDKVVENDSTGEGRQFDENTALQKHRETTGAILRVQGPY